MNDTLKSKGLNNGDGTTSIFLEKDVKQCFKQLKKKDGIQQIEDNLKLSFEGTIRDALENGYDMDTHYVIVDWKFFHTLLKKKHIDKLSGFTEDEE